MKSSLADMKVLTLLLQELDETKKNLFYDSRCQDWDLKPGQTRSALRSCTTLAAVARKQKHGGKKGNRVIDFDEVHRKQVSGKK
jgi:hypothetical protein